jgi:uncharacterized 2Fe-2S/4Fe-4S cluster protein (DUF4445 family)
MTYTVTFEPWGTAVEIQAGSTLLDAARAAGISLGAVCGGRGSCGKCLVRVLHGALPEVTPTEQRLLSPGSLDRGERLACRMAVIGDVTAQTLRVSIHGKESVPPFPAFFSPDPCVRRLTVRVVSPTLDHAIDDAGSLLEALCAQEDGAAAGVDYRAAQELPATLRSAGWNVTASVRSGEVIAVRAAVPARSPLGLAVDLGTTTIAAYLYRLEEGDLLQVLTVANPLSTYGADIITRMSHAVSAPGNGSELQRILVKCVNSLVESAARGQGGEPRDIEEMVVVGNSGMHHLFLDLPGRSLMEAPFVPAVRAALTVKAREIGIHVAAGASIYMPPLVGGFIGSDLVAVALVSRMGQGPSVRLALDIGTNTELLLSVDGSLSACSTASGPALEGAALRFGSLAVPGAIDRVWESGTSAAPSWATIDGKAVTGICGSGIVELLAWLRRTGTITGTGRLSAGAPGVVPSADGDHLFVIAAAAETALETDVTISQMEIRAIQLAKGAIRAGIDTLLADRGLGPDRIEEILVAGAFGSHLSVESMLEIGMLPPVPADRVRRIGNAAGTGAGMMLLSATERRAAADLAERIRYVELAQQPGFMKRFARSQWFPEEEK